MLSKSNIAGCDLQHSSIQYTVDKGVSDRQGGCQGSTSTPGPPSSCCGPGAGYAASDPGRITKPGNTSAAPALMEVVSIPPAKCSSPTPPTFKARATIHTPDFHHRKVSAHLLDHTPLDPAENTAVIMESAMQCLA